MTSVIRTLSDLVRINSVNPGYEFGAPESEIQRYVLEFFRAHGIDAFEQEVLTDRPNVIGRVPGRIPGRRLIFEAHCDTAGITRMTIPPFEPAMCDGRLYGRGACDTKAGLAAMMHAVADLKESDVTPPCEIWVVSAVGEEFDGRGAVRLCEGLTADAAVVSEPTGLRAVVATKGALRWRVVTKGKAMHSSKPHLGVNAVYLMARVLARLEEENERLARVEHPLVGPATVSVGVIAGGTQVNIVPESCIIEVDRRLIPGEDPETVYRQCCAWLDAENEPPLLTDGPLDTPCDAPIARLACEIVSEMGLDGRAAGMPYGSDASKLSRAGIRSIVLGPGSIDQAHTADEWVAVEEVEQAVAVYRRIMERFE
jgi:acetylornithine deacetylase/succinyl-diaminopimelate desuccinylase family protein